MKNFLKNFWLFTTICFITVILGGCGSSISIPINKCITIHPPNSNLAVTVCLDTVRIANDTAYIRINNEVFKVGLPK